jgi:tRNA modification GTPase
MRRAEAARSAVRSLQGEFSAAIDAMVAQLVELRALTEAMLDFPEEEVDSLHRDDAAARLARLRAALEDVLTRSREGSLLRAGIHVVLAGRPNVGKSSLLNRLAGAERAIVTPVPGTTRDALHEAIQIEGVPLVLVDTAGLRPSSDEVEQLGIERALKEVGQADLVLAVFDAAAGVSSFRQSRGPPRGDVYNRSTWRQDSPRRRANPAVTVSAKTGAGLEQLRRAILAAAGWTSHGESVFLARERHLRALGVAREHLQAAGAQSARWEFFAEELRLAQTALAGITGEISADDLLGEIFARFCIGK